MNNMYCVSIDFLKKSLKGIDIDSFLKVFTSERKDRDFRYYTEENFIELAPLYVQDNSIFITSPKQLIVSIYNRLYKFMLETNNDRFCRHRDKMLEKQCEDLIRGFAGPTDKIFPSICELKTGQYEHDLLWVHGRTVVIFEAKASHRKEPFRDPEKAYVRIKHDFDSEKGIQKGYDQALRLKEYILSKDEAYLYNLDGTVACTVSRKNIDKIFIIVITADNYGMIALNLSLLLTKPTTETYPLCCNLHDLETIIEGLKYKKKNCRGFLFIFARARKIS